MTVENPNTEAPAAENPKPAPEAPKVPKGDLPQTHEQLNALLAKHRKGLQGELQETKQQATEREKAFLELKSQVESFTEGVPVDEFMKGVEATLSKLDSDAEKAAKEARKTAKAYEEAQKRAETFETKWKQDRIETALSQAASGKTVSEAAARLVAKELRDSAVVKEDGSVVFPKEVTDEDGETEVKELTAAQAVAILEQDVTNYGTLFKSSVASGAGSEVDGITRTREGKIDVGSLSFEEHMRLKKENPGLYAKALRGEA